ncbi:MAG: sulfatase [Saprospiraceae bacterium]
MNPIKTIVFFGIAVLLVQCSLIAQSQDKRPNIIMIFSDDHALQAISAYGSPHIKTPNIDRIASEGAIFKNTFVTNSICAPSRAVLLTGKYNHINGQYDNRNETKINTGQDMYPKHMQQHGYQTAWIGKWHINNLPQYFDYWKILPGQGLYYNPDFIKMDSSRVRIDGYTTDIITEQAIDWLDKGRDKTKPFSLVIGHKAPHREWQPDTKDLNAFDGKPFAVPDNFFDGYKGRNAAAHQDMEVKNLRWDWDSKVNTQDLPFVKRMTPEQRQAWNQYYDTENAKLDTSRMTSKEIALWKYQRYMHDYMACILSLDRNIGKVLDYLTKKGLDKNTIVMYSSDQGFYLGEHGWYDKRFMYEQSLRAPFVMKYPGVISPKTVIEDMVVNIDFAPTLLDIAGIKAPADMQGKSVLPLTQKTKPVKSWRKSMYYHYYEYPDPHRVLPHLGIRTERYKLILFYGDGSHSWELFDIKNDPDEMHNIYGQPSNRKLTSQLKKELKQLMIQYKDKDGLKILAKAP